MNTKIAVLCSGRGSNLGALMEAREKGLLPVEIVLVLSDNAKAGALMRAREHGIYATFVPRSAYHANREGFEKRLVEILKESGAEFIVLAGFERLIGPALLEAFPERIINIHPALLPAFPGLDVWGTQLDYGVKLAGATVHFVDNGCDTGPIIIQGAVPVLDDDSPASLSARILTVEHKILPQAVRWLAERRLTINGHRVTLTQGSGQNASAASFSAPPQSLIWPPLNS